jgi:preprotein translocase subunit SecE
MSMDDLNREQKRQLKKMGAVDEQGRPTRGTRTATAPKRPDEPKTTFPQYLREVRAEMRKVSWPSWDEVRKYSIVVLVTVVIFTAFVFGLDSLFGELSGWLYGE